MVTIISANVKRDHPSSTPPSEGLSSPSHHFHKLFVGETLILVVSSYRFSSLGIVLSSLDRM